MSYKDLAHAARIILGEGATVTEHNMLLLPGRDPIPLGTDTDGRLLLEEARRYGFEWLFEPVEIARQPGDWRGCSVPRYLLYDPHLRAVSGGIERVNPGGQQMLYARVSCTDVPAGSLAHSCAHGPPPHSILVWVPKGRKPTVAYQRLRDLAEQRDALRTLVFSRGWLTGDAPRGTTGAQSAQGGR